MFGDLISSELIGVVLGGGLVIVTNWIERNAQRRHDRKALAGALSAEIDAYISLMERRNHSQIARSYIAAAKDGQTMSGQKWMTQAEAERSPFILFEANLDKVGILGNAACRSLATFHARIQATRATVAALQDGFYDQLSPRQQASLLEPEINQWDEAMQQGKALSLALQKL